MGVAHRWTPYKRPAHHFIAGNGFRFRWNDPEVGCARSHVVYPLLRLNNSFFSFLKNSLAMEKPSPCFVTLLKFWLFWFWSCKRMSFVSYFSLPFMKMGYPGFFPWSQRRLRRNGRSFIVNDDLSPPTGWSYLILASPNSMTIFRSSGNWSNPVQIQDGCLDCSFVLTFL